MTERLRRQLLITAGLTGALPWLAGCHTPPHAGASLPDAPGPCLDTATGRPLDEVQWQSRLATADVLLLGEYHDHPLHHAWRARVISRLAHSREAARAPWIVAEHLEGPLDPATRVQWSRPNAPTSVDTADARLLADLQAAGLDARAWQWPMHRPLFRALAERDLPVEAGNLPRDLVRAVGREGIGAAPARLQTLLTAAPLSREAESRLDADLVDSHCGHLQGPRLTAMRAAQRVRDAAMAHHLLERHRQHPDRPIVLLAGNGHVRLDYGVPVLLRALAPEVKVLSVGLLETRDLAAAGGTGPLPYDLVFIAPDVTRDDPCRP